jgi:hypothetical protein
LTQPPIPLEQLPGLDNTSLQALVSVGIASVQDLYGQTRSPDQQVALAQQLRLHLNRVRRWTALADLALVPGVDCRWCGLLLHGGIVSRQQLAQQMPAPLHQRLQRLSAQATGDRTLSPDLAQVNRWIAAAQELS